MKKIKDFDADDWSVVVGYVVVFMFSIGLGSFMFDWMCGDWREDYDTGFFRKYKGHKNVVVENDNQQIIDDGYEKPRYLYVKDLKDGATRCVGYFSDFYSFAQPGDTITLYVPRFGKLYKAKHYNAGKSNLREAVEILDDHGVYAVEAFGQTYIEDSYGMIESHHTAYHVQEAFAKVQKAQKEREKQEELKRMEQEREYLVDSLRTEFAYMSKDEKQQLVRSILRSGDENLKYALGVMLTEERERVTDSLRVEFDGMTKAQRQKAEKKILHYGDDVQKRALRIIRAEERDWAITDSLETIWEQMEYEEEQERIKAEREAEREEREELLRIEREEREAEREENRIIMQHKRNGTLWKYIESENAVITDTVTVVRVFSEKQLKGSLRGKFSANYSADTIKGGGAGISLLGIGIGGGGISGGAARGSASGNLNGDVNYASHGAIVARDKYGYQYTFPADPMMQVKTGDKIILEYYGRIYSSAGYTDYVKVLNVKYR